MDRITGDALLDLIPQRPPFVLIDALVSADDTSCATAFRISGDHVLCDDGRLNHSGLLENMAQTAAAMSGYMARQKGDKQDIGFIGDIRDFTCTHLPSQGDEIITYVDVETEIFEVTIVIGRVLLADREIASCRMKIFKMPAD